MHIWFPSPPLTNQLEDHQPIFISALKNSFKKNVVLQSLSRPTSPTPDDDVFRHLATVYATRHLTMHRGKQCDAQTPPFPGGVTNGAKWYPLTGGSFDLPY